MSTAVARDIVNHGREMNGSSRLLPDLPALLHPLLQLSSFSSLLYLYLHAFYSFRFFFGSCTLYMILFLS